MNLSQVLCSLNLWFNPCLFNYISQWESCPSFSPSSSYEVQRRHTVNQSCLRTDETGRCFKYTFKPTSSRGVYWQCTMITMEDLSQKFNNGSLIYDRNRQKQCLISSCRPKWQLTLAGWKLFRQLFKASGWLVLKWEPCKKDVMAQSWHPHSRWSMQKTWK